MKKYSFKNDYSEWCHPNILKTLSSSNLEQQQWYWEDIYSQKARELIQKKIWKKSSIYFVSWWTQANLIVISSILKPYESVICVDTWHINVHEAWAIESTWHKINYVKNLNWKITKKDIQEILDIHGKDHHMVKPRMVYISNSTEIWTIYSKKELIEIQRLHHQALEYSKALISLNVGVLDYFGPHCQFSLNAFCRVGRW
jgi:threonine aldolase